MPKAGQFANPTIAPTPVAPAPIAAAPAPAPAAVAPTPMPAPVPVVPTPTASAPAPAPMPAPAPALQLTIPVVEPAPTPTPAPVAVPTGMFTEAAPVAVPAVVEPTPVAPAPVAAPPVVPTPAPAATAPTVPTAPTAPAMPAVAPPAVPAVDLSQLQDMFNAPPVAPQADGQAGAVDLRSFNMSGVQTNNFRLLDPSLEYEAVIEETEMKRATSDGTSLLMIGMKITAPQEFRGVKIFDYLSLKDSAIWRFKSLCEACEMLSPDGSRFTGNSEKDFNEYIVRFSIRHDEYAGQQRNKVNGIYAAGYESPEITGVGVAG